MSKHRGVNQRDWRISGLIEGDKDKRGEAEGLKEIKRGREKGGRKERRR